MKLASLLTPEQVILDLKAEVCVDAIAEIVDYLISLELLDLELRGEVISSLCKREEEVSTGIGSGVAIPHVFSESIDKVITCFAHSKEGVEFESIDHALVNYIILFIVPKKDYNLHLQTLAGIAKMFNNCELRRCLGSSTTAEEVLDIFERHSLAQHTHL